MKNHLFFGPSTRKQLPAGFPILLLFAVAGICLGVLLPAKAQGPPASPPENSREAAGDAKRPEPISPPGRPMVSEPDAVRGSGSMPAPLWRQHYHRLMEVNREQAQIGMQQKAIQSRLAQPEASGRSPGRERLAGRLHELDAREREVRKLKRTILQDLVQKAETIQAAVEESRTQLVADESAETEPARLEAILRDQADLQRFQRFLRIIRQDPERFMDFIPDGPDAVAAPPAPAFLPGNPPPQFHMQIRRIEEQIRFLREKLAQLEMELHELKSFVGSDGLPHEAPNFPLPDFGRSPAERDARRNPPSALDEQRPRYPQRRSPGARRDTAPNPDQSADSPPSPPPPEESDPPDTSPPAETR